MGYFLTGLVGTAFALAFPFLIDDFSLSLSVAGLVFPVQSLGGFCGALVGGIWSDSVGRKPLIGLGALCLVAGYALIPMTRNWLFALPAFFLLGTGGGFVSAALNALVAEVNPNRRALALNALHGIYGLGSLIGPLLAATLLERNGGNWHVIFLGSAVLYAAYGIIGLIPLYPASGGRQQGRFRHARPLLLSPVFLLLLAIPFLYNGTATGLVGWISTYVQNEVQLPIFMGASMVSLFYVGLTIGRFICGAIGERVGYGRMLLTLSVGTAASYPLVVISQSPWVLGAGVFLSGLFFSGLFPTALAWSTRLYPSATGTITGILSTGMSIGGMTIPPLLGMIGDRMGLGFGMTVNYVGVALLVFVALGLLRSQRQVKKAA